MSNNVVVVSDIHAGCQVGLCPPSGVQLDGGGVYMPSAMQLKMWSMWEEFWKEWVPLTTRKEPYDIVINGDTLDGVHHGSTTQISHNLADQERAARVILEPIIANKKVRRLFVIRGTEAHVGKSGVEEERLAQNLGAVPNDIGNYARHELFLRVGGALTHIMHHIGTTGSSAYESTAVHKELIEALTESARHRLEPIDVVVRSHRHRYFRTSFAASTTDGDSRDAIAVVTPGWQAKTPFAFRIAGARLSLPQFGGILIRTGNEDAVFVRHRTWHLTRPAVE